MSESKPNFRRKALERLSSPDRLDEVIDVVDPHAWLAAGGFAVLFGFGLIWSLFGNLPTSVEGQGVLIRPRVVQRVAAPAAGRVSELNIEVGQTFEEGDVLATIAQSQATDRLDELRARLATLKRQDSTRTQLETKQASVQAEQLRLDAQLIEQRRDDLRANLRSARELEPVLEERLEGRLELEELGLAPRLSNERLAAKQSLIENQNLQTSLEAELIELDSELARLDVRRSALELEATQVSDTRGNEILSLEAQIAVEEAELRRSSQVLAESSGRVLEISVNTSQIVNIGEALASIEVDDVDSDLVALSFFAVGDGKLIHPGMESRITPDTVERARFGGILSRVIAVSQVPVTSASVDSIVGSSQLASSLVKNEAYIEVRAELEQDPSTHSGFRWSSSKGPEQLLDYGVTTQSFVVVERRAPITYLLPFLRELVGIY
ncbi:MAG: NHLP bacteriocin system secretion protein [Acidobacteriota bacterium]